MPLFFFISGFLYNPLKYSIREFISKRSKTILIPSIYFTIIVATLAYFLIDYDFKELTYRLPWALWFLPVLFMTEVFVRLINNKYILIGFIIFGPIISFFLQNHNIELPYSISVVPTAMSFYIFGHEIRTRGLEKIVSNKIVITGYLISLLFVVYGNIRIAMVDNYMKPLLLAYITAVIGIFSTLSLSNIISSKNNLLKDILIFLGTNTLIIMCLQQLFLNISDYYIRPIVPWFIFYKILQQVFVWSLAYLSIKIINKRFSFLIGK